MQSRIVRFQTNFKRQFASGRHWWSPPACLKQVQQTAWNGLIYLLAPICFGCLYQSANSQCSAPSAIVFEHFRSDWLQGKQRPCLLSPASLFIKIGQTFLLNKKIGRLLVLHKCPLRNQRERGCLTDTREALCFEQRAHAADALARSVTVLNLYYKFCTTNFFWSLASWSSHCSVSTVYSAAFAGIILSEGNHRVRIYWMASDVSCYWIASTIGKQSAALVVELQNHLHSLGVARNLVDWSQVWVMRFALDFEIGNLQRFLSDVYQFDNTKHRKGSLKISCSFTFSVARLQLVMHSQQCNYSSE